MDWRLQRPTSQCCLGGIPTAQVGQELDGAELTSNSWFWGLGPSALSWPCFDFLFEGGVTRSFPDWLWPEWSFSSATLDLDALLSVLPEVRVYRLVPAGPASHHFWFSVCLFRSFTCEVIFKIDLVTRPDNLGLYWRYWTGSRGQSCGFCEW